MAKRLIRIINLVAITVNIDSSRRVKRPPITAIPLAKQYVSPKSCGFCGAGRKVKNELVSLRSTCTTTISTSTGQPLKRKIQGQHTTTSELRNTQRACRTWPRNLIIILLLTLFTSSWLTLSSWFVIRHRCIASVHKAQNVSLFRESVPVFCEL